MSWRTSISRALGGLPMALVYALIAGITLLFVGFIPMWDGAAYTDLLTAAAQRPFDLYELSYFGHPTQVYSGLLSIPLRLIDHEDYRLVILVNGLLALLTAFFAYRIARLLAPEPEGELEAACVAALVSLSPAFLANLFNFNLDYPLAVFLVVLLYGLLAEKPVLAVLGSLGMTFSKETGAAVYVLAAASYLLFFVLRRDAPFGRKVVLLLRKWYLSIAALAFGAWVYVAVFVTHRQAVWTHEDKYKKSGSLLSSFLRVDFNDWILQGWLANVFLLSFGWILSLAIALLALRRLLRWVFGAKLEEPPPPIESFFFFLFGVSTFVVTRYLTNATVRYILCLLPLLAFCGAIAIRRLVRARPWRVGILAVTALLFLLSCFRTIDPVSRLVWGTFPFGRHRMLITTSVAGQGFGYGIDHLTYNLEYLQLHYLQDLVFPDVRPTPETLFVGTPDVSWYMPTNRVDARTFRRTARRPETITIDYTDVNKVREGSIPDGRSDFYYVAFPNGETDSFIKELGTVYDTAWQKTYERWGYQLRVFRFRKKG